MGSTLEHGIYLPSEGEKNCYQGLAGNWNKVDGALGDIAELKQSIESKFTKEIVTELPTEDINPFCIYMILKTDPETDNVYDEWVYINNAWEYLGNTKVDMTQYYTKQEVNELPAVASGVTATKVGNYDAHIANGDIHVTASDKTKWTNSANTHVLRLAKSALTPSTSDNSFSNLDDSTTLKVGDKVMDTAGVLFEVTAIDTANSTFSIGTALIDLAQDSDVVHKSGNETVGGAKTFTDNNMIKTSSPKVLLINTSQTGNTPPSSNAASFFRFDGGTVNNFGGVQCEFLTTGENRLTNYVKDITTAKLNSIQQRASSTTAMTVFNADLIAPATDGITALGSSSKRWSNIYGMNYYYGSNNVEFSQKFVTTDTAQTISGGKTFNGNTNYVGELNQTAPFKMTADTSFVTGSRNTSIYDQNGFQCANDLIIYNNSKNIRRTWTVNNNSSGTTVSAGFNFILSASGQKVFYPITNDDTDSGSSSAYWKNTYTKRVNGVEPSSLSLPSGNLNDVIDISSYLVNLDGTNNTYVAPANGWISITLSNCSGIQAYINGLWGNQLVRSSAGAIRFLMPILKNLTVNILIFGGTIDNARFIPCQGNV